MDVSSINSDLIRGNVTTIILGCLWSNDKYGYEILKEIEDKSNSQYVIKQATLYNQLKRLEQQGLITSYDGDPDDTGGGKRKYFALTLDGRNFLKKEKNEYEYARTILDKLVSSQEYDFNNPTPFNASELRPYSLHIKEEKPEVVYKDKIVEVEKIVEIEKKVYVDDNGNEISEEDFNILKEEKELERNKTHKTLEELFAQIDAKDAEITKLNDEKIQVAKDNEEKLLKQQEEFKRQQEIIQEEARLKEAEKQKQKEKEDRELEELAKKAKSLLPTATVSRNENGFEYEKEKSNYKEFFFNLRADESPTNQEQINNVQKDDNQYSSSDIKTRLYVKGYKIRPYDKGNTTEYYTFKFIQSNRLNKDTFFIILGLFLLELAIMWSSTYKTISYVYYLPILIIGSLLCLIPLFIYLLNPIKRTRANFNFKLSILNRAMIWIELSVICILIGFFGFGATYDDITIILCSMVLPSILLTNIPISSLIYWLLYRTRNYHTA